MKKVMQLKDIILDPEGNLVQNSDTMPAIIASFLDLDSPDQVLQVQDLYPEDYNSSDAVWELILTTWLRERGWNWGPLPGHLMDGSYYIVYGVSERGDNHACIYQNGELFHDPHPSGAGLESEEGYEFLEPLGFLFQ